MTPDEFEWILMMITSLLSGCREGFHVNEFWHARGMGLSWRSSKLFWWIVFLSCNLQYRNHNTTKWWGMCRMLWWYPNYIKLEFSWNIDVKRKVFFKRHASYVHPVQSHTCGHHQHRGKTTIGLALDGVVLKSAHILAYLAHNMIKSQLYLGFGHLGSIFWGQ